MHVLRTTGGLFSSIWILVFATSCGGSSTKPPPTKGSYRLALFAYHTEAGRRLELRVKPKMGSMTLASYAGVVRPDGTLEVVVPEVMETGVEYRVDYYVDLDGNGEYTLPRGAMFTDPSWRRFVTGDATGVNDSAAHDDRWVDVSPF
jgi:hypothetical protein